MTKTMTITKGSVCTSSVNVVVRSVTGAASGERSPRMPFSIPRTQLYYWTSEWQKGEAEALADLGNGESREFDNFVDLAKYLLGPDED